MKILAVKERKDGSASLTFSLHKKDEAILKKIAIIRKSKYTKKFAREAILEAITNYVTLKEEERNARS